ncbi:SRPBCC family protein [Actinoplanes sp. NEAU-A12]|uniref:SRPBCC family protein n=1 Tax=Actinoplanes sandaracinus TaxID=3045177 RepID=A0ABT6WG62_9ACTN|nr:SRPBCC family protein [Actinoplanes sandaracinus]MDI6098716.1 SRPBCC family protein [Actinoplanes sandaracinus]
MRTTGWTGIGGATLMAAATACSPLARHWYLTYGATGEETALTLPGDDLLPDPDIQSTRAITIAAPPSAVWPWLVQMGGGRGGAYTYDWIENLLALDVHSADDILPQFQHLAVGDVLPLRPKGPGMRVEICDPERTIAFRSTDGTWVWILHLTTRWLKARLISRNRILVPGATWPRRLVGRAVMEPGSLIMERRMLLGIKQRAQWSAPSAEALLRRT